MRLYKRFLGGNAEGVTPVPIPNTEVKPLWADGTAWVAVWESRAPPPQSFFKSKYREIRHTLIKRECAVFVSAAEGIWFMNGSAVFHDGAQEKIITS